MLAFICALPREASQLRKLDVVRNGHADLVCAGVGPRHAERATRELLDKTRPALVLSTGVAGALSPTLKIGDVVTAREVVDAASGLRFPCAVPSHIEHPASSILSVPRMITSPEEKKSLHQQFHAVAVDMESAAVARVCAARGVPFAAIRAVSDTADQVLPQAVTQFFDDRGRVRLSKVLIALLKQPSLIGTLRELGHQTAEACESLGDFLGANITRTTV